MSRAKKGAAFEGQVPAQKEAAESPSSMEQLLKSMIEKLEESIDKKLQGLKEEMNDRFQELELKQQQTSHAGNTGPHEEKSGERDATEVGGLTPSEQQLRLAASSSYEPSQFFKMEQPRQQPPPPPSQPPPLTYHYPQPFSAPEPFLAGR